MDGWRLSDLERGSNQVRSPCTPQLSSLQWCKGNEGSKEGCSPHGEVTQWRHHSRVPPISVGQRCAAFSTLLRCYRSPVSLRWSSLWDIAKGRRCGGGQDALRGRNHRTLLHCSTQETPLVLFAESSRNIWIERWLFSNLCVIHFSQVCLVRWKIISGVNEPLAWSHVPNNFWHL